MPAKAAIFASIARLWLGWYFTVGCKISPQNSWHFLHGRRVGYVDRVGRSLEYLSATLAGFEGCRAFYDRRQNARKGRYFRSCCEVAGGLRIWSSSDLIVKFRRNVTSVFVQGCWVWVFGRVSHGLEYLPASAKVLKA